MTSGIRATGSSARTTIYGTGLSRSSSRSLRSTTSMRSKICAKSSTCSTTSGLAVPSVIDAAASRGTTITNATPRGPSAPSAMSRAAWPRSTRMSSECNHQWERISMTRWQCAHCPIVQSGEPPSNAPTLMSFDRYFHASGVVQCAGCGRQEALRFEAKTASELLLHLPTPWIGCTRLDDALCEKPVPVCSGACYAKVEAA